MAKTVILGTRRVAGGPWLGLFERRHRRPDGRVGAWSFASRRPDPAQPRDPWPAADAVVFCALARGADGVVRAAMSREFRVPLGGFEWGFGAGLREPGESPEETGARELGEEFPGLRAVRSFPHLTSPLLASSAGLSDEAVVMVFLEAAGELAASAGGDGGEEIYPVLLRFEEVMSLMEDRSQVFAGKAWPVLLGWKWAGKLTFGEPGL